MCKTYSNSWYNGFADIFLYYSDPPIDPFLTGTEVAETVRGFRESGFSQSDEYFMCVLEHAYEYEL